ncbi:hypothetical protein MY5147_000415, partial [Beauveria neobassiana]
MQPFNHATSKPQPDKLTVAATMAWMAKCAASRRTKHFANPEGVVWSQVLPLLPASALGTPELRWASPAIYSAFYSSLPPKYSPDYL